MTLEEAYAVINLAAERVPLYRQATRRRENFTFWIGYWLGMATGALVTIAAALFVFGK